MSAASTITGCILAGGAGRRLGGADKGLVTLGGRTLVEHCIARLAPQVDAIVISANRNLDAYRRGGVRVLADELPGYAGPLAGLLTVMRAVTTRYVVTAACDSPFIPTDMVARLLRPVAAGVATISVVVCDGRLQPVFALYDVGLAAALAAYLDGGGRKLDTWFRQERLAEVDFSAAAAAFININTPADLAHARALLDADADHR